MCGLNNCPILHGFKSEVDCCYQPTVGDEHFCTNNNPCAVDEGDCDSNNECQTNLYCASSCPIYLGFTSDVNCCSNVLECKVFHSFLSHNSLHSIRHTCISYFEIDN